MIDSESSEIRTRRAYFSSSIADFRAMSPHEILGQLTDHSEFDVTGTQVQAWRDQISILQPELQDLDGEIYFEFVVPRVGRRIDVVLIIGAAIFVLEFKAGEKEYPRHAIDQKRYDPGTSVTDILKTSVTLQRGAYAMERSRTDEREREIYHPGADGSLYDQGLVQGLWDQPEDRL